MNTEIGAITPGSSASPPSNPNTFPASTKQVSNGITLDGDVALTDTGGSFHLSKSFIHSQNAGPATPGAQGIDCAGAFSSCSDSGIDADSKFNTTDPAAYSGVSENNGAQSGIDHSALVSEMSANWTNWTGLANTGALDWSGNSGKISSDTTTTYGSGLHIIDIATGGNDFLLENSNWRIEGQADTTVIFRFLTGSKNFKISNGRIGLGGDIGINNVLFLVDGSGTTSIDFSDAEFYGTAFWDLGSGLSGVNFNNVKGCGQLVADKINLQDSSMSGCTYGTPPAPVPVPASGLLLAGAIVGLGAMRRRKMLRRL